VPSDTATLPRASPVIVPASASGPEAATTQAPSVTAMPPPTAAPVTSQAPPGGRNPPGYEVLGVLGRGGMGIVYKARQTTLGRVVALKMILAGGDAGPEELARFHAEAEAIARLQHPHIVQVFEVGAHDGQPFLSLEYCPGGTLEKKLAGKPMPPGDAAALVERLAEAVQGAHEAKVVHRDLKPANVLLTEDGTPKITDFGLAKKLDDASLTASGTIMGTPAYMAPEQAGGKRNEVGPAADVYALGGILYACLTGRPPFQSASVLEVLRQVTSDEPRPPRQLRRGLPRDLETICLKCLQKNPRNRYPSALALSEDLRRYSNGEPLQARPPGRAELAWRWCLRNPVPASLLLTVTALLAVGLWQLSRVQDRIVMATALEGTKQEAKVIDAAWGHYSDEVVDRVRGSQDVQVRHDYKTHEKAIPNPAKFITALGDKITAEHQAGDGMQLRLYSGYPFVWQKSKTRGPQGEFEATAWRKLRDGEAEDYSEVREDQEGRPALHYAWAIRLDSNECVACHNRYVEEGSILDETLKEKRTRPWALGDVRGVQVIVRPLDTDAKRAKTILRDAYWLVGGVAAALLALCAVVLAVARRRSS